MLAALSDSHLSHNASLLHHTFPVNVRQLHPDASRYAPNRAFTGRTMFLRESLIERSCYVAEKTPYLIVLYQKYRCLSRLNVDSRVLFSVALQ